jgi:nitroreductase
MQSEPRLTRPNGTIVPQVRSWLRAAVAAPSVYNTQPWLFRVTEREIEVYADQARRLEVVDPRGRELMVSVGAALFNLRVAMLADGRTPMVHLLPDGDQGDLVARVRPGPAVAVSETVRLLAEAIPRRHTNRRPFESTSVPPEVVADLCSAAAVEGCDLVVAEPTLREALLGVVRAAEHLHRRDPDYYVELADWTANGRPRGDGVPPETFGPWSALEVVPLRDFGLVRPVPSRTVTEYEAEPTIALLYSQGDDREQWLRAGQALERTLLTASVRGLASTLMTQPIEIPRLRDMFAISAIGAVAQAVLRFGYGPPSAPSPRRALSSVLLNEGAPLSVR